MENQLENKDEIETIETILSKQEKKGLEALNQEIYHLNYLWIIHENIRENTEVLNETGNHFWDFYQHLLIDGIFLSIGKLVECSKKTINLKKFSKILKKNEKAYKDLRRKIATLIETNKLCKSIVKHRHKRIAHTNFNWDTGNFELPKGITYENIESVIKEIRGIHELLTGQSMVLYDNNFNKLDGWRDTFILNHDINFVIFYLKEGVEYVKLKQCLNYGDKNYHINNIYDDDLKKIISKIYADPGFRAKVVACLKEGL